MAHYVHDENHNRIPAYSAEEVLNVLAQAIEDGDLDDVTADNAFITRLKSVADGKTYFVAFLTQAEYNSLVQEGRIAENTIYYITDDTTISDIEAAIANLQESTSANFQQLQNDVGDMQSDISVLKAFNDTKVGIPQTISYSSQEQEYFVDEINTAGLYAVNLKYTYEGDDFYCSAMLSISNLNVYSISAKLFDETVHIAYRGGNVGGLGHNVICIDENTSGLNLRIEDCYLIVPYKAAE